MQEIIYEDTSGWKYYTNGTKVAIPESKLNDPREAAKVTIRAGTIIKY